MLLSTASWRFFVVFIVTLTPALGGFVFGGRSFGGRGFGGGRRYGGKSGSSSSAPKTETNTTKLMMVKKNTISESVCKDICAEPALKIPGDRACYCYGFQMKPFEKVHDARVPMTCAQWRESPEKDACDSNLSWVYGFNELSKEEKLSFMNDGLIPKKKYDFWTPKNNDTALEMAREFMNAPVSDAETSARLIRHLEAKYLPDDERVHKGWWKTLVRYVPAIYPCRNVCGKENVPDSAPCACDGQFSEKTWDDSGGVEGATDVTTCKAFQGRSFLKRRSCSIDERVGTWLRDAEYRGFLLWLVANGQREVKAHVQLSEKEATDPREEEFMTAAVQTAQDVRQLKARLFGDK